MNLAHKFLLLDLDRRTGFGRADSVYGSKALAGCVLAAMEAQGLWMPVGAGKFALSATAASTGAFPAAVRALTHAKPWTWKQAQHKLSQGRPYRELRQQVASELVKAGILASKPRRFLVFQLSTAYPEKSGAAEDALRRELRDLVMGRQAPQGPPTDTELLLSVLRGGKLLGWVFSRAELARFKATIDTLTDRCPLGRTTKICADETHAAMIAATSAAVT